MRDRHEVIATVRELLGTSWPERFEDHQLRDHVSLGEEGLGLDSVEIVELLLACEDRYERPVGPELWSTVPLTIAAVADYFAFGDTVRAAGSRAST